MFLADLHLHSNFSDGQLSIREVVDLMGTHGMGAIAITDHLCEEKTLLGKAAKFLNKTLTRSNFDEYIQEIHYEAERAWRLYKMLVIPGVEITKNSFSHRDSAHILALDIHEYIRPDLPLRDLIKSIHGQGGLAIAAHPVHTFKNEHQTLQLWDVRDSIKDLIDAWEVASGKHLFPEVQASDLPKIANSDMHKPHQVESWKTAFTCNKTKSAIKSAIKMQDLQFRYYKPEVTAPSLTTSISHFLPALIRGSW